MTVVDRADVFSHAGAGFCVLKPLDLALRDGDVIRGVIRNTAVNQDGHTPGITLPAAEAQEALIRKIYADAGLSLDKTSYVEAHGTGTPAGDPVEAAALAATFGRARATGDPLYIGSVKSNVGHLEGGSGLVQVVKAVMMIEQGKIPPSLYYEKPNPRIPMEEWNLRVPTDLIPWPTSGLRRVSINSFGYGGTNAHCILDDAYHYLKSRRLVGNHNVTLTQSISSTHSDSEDSGVSVTDSERHSVMKSSSSTPCQLLVWSSHDQDGTARTAASYASYLTSTLPNIKEKQRPEILKRLSYTLATRRSRLPWKSFTIAGSLREALTSLEHPATKPVRSANSRKVRLAFIFTGQGAQWYAMGRELFDQPTFRKSIKDADSYLKEIGATWSLTGKFSIVMVYQHPENLTNSILQRSSGVARQALGSGKRTSVNRPALHSRSRLSTFYSLGM